MRHPFYDFVGRILAVVFVGLIGIQLTLMMELYILAGMLIMSMILFSMGATFGYMYRKRR